MIDIVSVMNRPGQGRFANAFLQESLTTNYRVASVSSKNSPMTALGKVQKFVMCLVSNGHVMVNATVHHHESHFCLTPQTIGDAEMDDWLIKYTREECIDFPR